MPKAFVIAAPWSNSGKTTLCLGLCRLLSKKGLRVQPFKCGPDYIDTMLHSRAAGVPSLNLDSVMMSEVHIQALFQEYASTADVALVEGVMGLFDGAVKVEGSTAALARLLELPVILVVDASAMGYSVAPLLHGLKTFDPRVCIAGVVFNFVHSQAHYAFLKAACEDVGLQALGFLPPNEAIKIPSRYLGLHLEAGFESAVEMAAEHLEEHLDIDELLSFGKSLERGKEALVYEKSGSWRIAVAQDEAFSFTYTENLRKLRSLGEVVYFSPLRDAALPPADLLYLAGGYPEWQLEQLAANQAMRHAIAAFAAAGGKILAECGGMMYLGKSIIDEKGTAHPMAGVFGFSTSMENKQMVLGYRKLTVGGMSLSGHEFRYSQLFNAQGYSSAAKVYSARGQELDTALYRYKGVWASYIHFYWAESDFIAYILSEKKD